HVVEQNRLGTVLQGFVELFHRPDFDLDGLLPAAIAMRPLQRFGDSAGERDVVVLDENAVGQIQAVVHAAATAHSVLVEHPPAGNGLARVENAGVRADHGIHIFAGERCDSAHALQYVQYYALAGEQYARVVPHYSDLLATVRAHAVKYLGMGGDFGIGDHSA